MRIFLVAVALLIAACSTPLPQGTTNLPLQNTAYHDEISLTGRLSVSYWQNGKREALQGKFSWDQHKDTTHIALFSPLGQTIAHIAITPGLATLKQSGMPVREANNIDDLTQDALGWPMPVSGLRDWLQGFNRDARGLKPVTAASLQSADWQIRYVSWQEDVNGATFPKRIDLKRSAGEAGQITLKIIIDNRQVK